MQKLKLSIATKIKKKFMQMSKQASKTKQKYFIKIKYMFNKKQSIKPHDCGETAALTSYGSYAKSQTSWHGPQ
jgi:hypothetical protein